jgi:2-polyprenyl-3-methyl-5-hydroxy-6-metoxy-1,4-benzoquinol methylase
MNTLLDKEGKVKINRQNNGFTEIEVEPLNNTFIPIRNCETPYPPSLIELIFKVKGASYLCDEICRDIDPNYVQRDLEQDLTAYFAKEDFAGKRILDFGCGSGASSMILSRMFPDAEVVGIELEEKLLEIAGARLEFYKYKNIEFHASPSGNELPPNIGEFDFVIMSAVYEHLLPGERALVIPKVWSVIKPNGYLFLNMTPHRWFPIEHHTTGLPLLNYLPAKIALPVVRKFSRRTDSTDSWELLLRRGIRGGTENEIIEILKKSSENKPVLIEPSRKNLKDRIDLWYSQLNQQNHLAVKKLLRFSLKTIRAVSGATLVPNLSLVIKKL